jgi:SnoaL-like protein
MKKLIRLAAGGLVFSIGLMAQSATAIKPAASPSLEQRALEQRVRAIEDRDAILKTLYQYAYLIDFGHEIREYTNLYTDDAIFQPNAANGNTPTSPGAVVGRAGLEKWITNEWQVRERLIGMGHYRIHETIGSDVALDGDRATVRSYFQTTDNDNGRIYIVSIGVYQDQLVRSPDGRWRIKERLLQRQGSVAPGTAGAPLGRAGSPQ